MSKIYYLITNLLIITCVAGCLFAQNTKPSVKNSYNDNDLFKLLDKSGAKLYEKVFRQTTTIEEFKIGNPSSRKNEKRIIENLPPDRDRMIVERKTNKGIERTEYIDIGRERYIRENNGEWKVFKPSGGGGSGMGAGDGDSETKVEYTEEKKFVGGEIVKGQKVDRYEQILKYTFTSPNKVEKAIKTVAYWFNTDGLKVKKLEEWQDLTNKTIKRQTEIYEYDIPLKIERPIVKTN